jgi:hypothetical protein
VAEFLKKYKYPVPSWLRASLGKIAFLGRMPGNLEGDLRKIVGDQLIRYEHIVDAFVSVGTDNIILLIVNSQDVNGVDWMHAFQRLRARVPQVKLIMYGAETDGTNAAGVSYAVDANSLLEAMSLNLADA